MGHATKGARTSYGSCSFIGNNWRSFSASASMMRVVRRSKTAGSCSGIRTVWLSRRRLPRGALYGGLLYHPSRRVLYHIASHRREHLRAWLCPYLSSEWRVVAFRNFARTVAMRRVWSRCVFRPSVDFSPSSPPNLKGQQVSTRGIVQGLSLIHI